MIISGYYGPEIWQSRVTDLIGPIPFLKDYNFREIWIPILVCIFLVIHLPFCIYNVVRARRRQGLPLSPVFLEWTPMVIYTFSIGAWLFSPTSTLLRENRLVLFCLTMSFVFGRMTTKIILAHLTRRPFPYWTAMLAPLIGGAVLANLPFLSGGQPSAVSASTELWYLRGYFIFALIVYFRWAILVINRICTFLDINCLTIPSKASSMPMPMPAHSEKEGRKIDNGTLRVEKDFEDSSGNGYININHIHRHPKKE